MLPPPPLPHVAIHRRGLLQAGLLLPALLPGLAACTEPVLPEPPPDPDAPLRDGAAAREQALLAAYDAAIASAPGLAVRLRALRAEHAEHLAALTPGVPPPPPDGAPPAVREKPARQKPARVLARLAAQERAAAAGHASAALDASPRLAQLLASLAASEGSHPVALR